MTDLDDDASGEDLRKPPKKPPTAYVLYSSEYRNEARERHPKASFSELGRILGEMWKNELTDDERQQYYKVAHESMEKWKLKYASWKRAVATAEVAASPRSARLQAAAAVAASSPTMAASAPRFRFEEGLARPVPGGPLARAGGPMRSHAAAAGGAPHGLSAAATTVAASSVVSASAMSVLQHVLDGTRVHTRLAGADEAHRAHVAAARRRAYVGFDRFVRERGAAVAAEMARTSLERKARSSAGPHSFADLGDVLRAAWTALPRAERERFQSAPEPTAG